MKFKLLIIILITLNFCSAQINPKTKWGQVSNEEIEFVKVDFAPDAAAVILYEEGHTSIMNFYETKVYRRYKILSEKGFEAANQEIEFYSYKNIEKIISIKAQTINIENGKTVITQVDKNSFFDTDINELWSVKKFAFPNVKVGSILELEYTINDRNIRFADAWRFQHKYPTLYSKYEMKNLSVADFNTLIVGEQLVSYSKNYQKSGVNKWELKNIPSYYDVKFLYNPKDASERISLQLKGYLNSKNELFNPNEYESVLGDWRDLNREVLNQYEKMTNEGTVKEIAAEIPDGISEFRTLENIYNYFKSNYRWNNFYGIYPRSSSREVHKNKTGNSADINILFNSVLKQKGLKTDFILVSSRNKGKVVTAYPYLGQFDMVINLVRTADGNSYLIDASDLSFDLGYAPLRNYNHGGLISEPGSDRFIVLKPPLSVNQSIQNYVVRNNKFMLTKIEKRNGYFKKIDDEIPEGIKEYKPYTLALDIKTNELNSQTKDSDEDHSQMERIQFETTEFTNANFIGVENPLKNIVNDYQLNETTRLRPLEFDFPFQYKVDVSIEIPEGFTVEIPAAYNTKRSLPNQLAGYSQTAQMKDGKLLVEVEFYVTRAVIDNKYSDIKNFFDQSILDVNKSILLRKN